MKKISSTSKDLTKLLAAAGIVLTASSASATVSIKNIQQVENRGINSASALYWEIEAEGCNFCAPDGQCKNGTCS